MDIGTKVREACWADGLLVRACGDSMVLSPPLIVTRGQVDEICTTLRDALDATAREIGH